MAEMHYFDVNIAKKYGVNAAVLLQNIYHWILKNKANKKNEFDGNTWTYNSKKAFAELFPYMNERQIDYAMRKLIDDDIIITGNYNKVAYDRTLWYAITKKGYSILQNCEMETTIFENGTYNNVDPIPDINTDLKTTDINARKKESKNNSFDKIIAQFTSDKKTIELLQEWLKVRKAKRSAMTDRAIQLNINKLVPLAKLSGMDVNTYLEEVIARGWAAFYEIKQFGQAKQNGSTSSGNVFLDIAKEEGIF